MRIVVAGVSGSGKSTIGTAVAARLAVPFRDGDDLHPADSIAKMAGGVPLTDVDREPWLHAVGSWLAEHEAGVIACSALARRYRDLIREACPQAWVAQLTAPADVLTQRQRERPGHFMPPALMPSQLALFEPLEDDEAGVVVDVSGSVEESVEQVLRAVG